MVAIPHRFFKNLAHTGQLSFLCLPPFGRYGIAMIFLPNGLESEVRRGQLMDIIETVVRDHGLSVLGWRSPLPTKSTILGNYVFIVFPIYVDRYFVNGMRMM